MIIDLLAALLRGELPAAGSQFDADPVDAALQLHHAARVHGVSELIAHTWHPRLANAVKQRPCIAELLRLCANDLRAGVALEMLWQLELRRLLECLHASGVAPLILKGSALAYGLYDEPALRPRADTDLLVPIECRQAADDALGRLGYTSDEASPTRLISTQTTWSFSDALGAEHRLDVHRKVNNSPLLARSFNFKILLGRAQALPALGPHALGLSDEDALLLACVHRAGHVDTPYHVDDDVHNDGDRLIWYHDMHLLLSRMPEASRLRFAEMARCAQLTAICRDALDHCIHYFHTPVSAILMQSLTAGRAPEQSTVYLRGSALQRAWQNWRSLSTWTEKAIWGWELCFPPVEHMRRKYPGNAKTPLLVLYCRRAWSGVRRLLQ